MDVDRIEVETEQFTEALERRDYETAEAVLAKIAEHMHQGFVDQLRRILGQARTDYPR